MSLVAQLAGGYKPPGSDPVSLSDVRAEKAQQWVEKEIDKLLENIKKLAKRNEDGHLQVTFGELFYAYADISDTLVGIMARAKKRNLIAYEGEGGFLLFQGRHDKVLVTIVEPGMKPLPAAPAVPGPSASKHETSKTANHHHHHHHQHQHPKPKPTVDTKPSMEQVDVKPKPSPVNNLMSFLKSHAPSSISKEEATLSADEPKSESAPVVTHVTERRKSIEAPKPASRPVSIVAETPKPSESHAHERRKSIEAPKPVAVIAESPKPSESHAHERRKSIEAPKPVAVIAESPKPSESQAHERRKSIEAPKPASRPVSIVAETPKPASRPVSIETKSIPAPAESPKEKSPTQPSKFSFVGVANAFGIDTSKITSYMSRSTPVLSPKSTTPPVESTPAPTSATNSAKPSPIHTPVTELRKSAGAAAATGSALKSNNSSPIVADLSRKSVSSSQSPASQQRKNVERSISPERKPVHAALPQRTSGGIRGAVLYSGTSNTNTSPQISLNKSTVEALKHLVQEQDGHMSSSVGSPAKEVKKDHSEWTKKHLNRVNSSEAAPLGSKEASAPAPSVNSVNHSVPVNKEASAPAPPVNSANHSVPVNSASLYRPKSTVSLPAGSRVSVKAATSTFEKSAEQNGKNLPTGFKKFPWQT